MIAHSLLILAALAQLDDGNPADGPAVRKVGQIDKPAARRRPAAPPAKLDGPEDPTRPAMVTLDFSDRTIEEIASALSSRSGSAVDVQNVFDPSGIPRKITLVAPEPVPFWDALDRFLIASRTRGEFQTNPGMSKHRASVMVSSLGVDPGPACYSGPMRIGKFTLHADYVSEFVPAPKNAPSGDVPPFRAEFLVQAEPRVVALATGPIARLEAVDELDHSLLDPAPEGQGQGVPTGPYDLGAAPSVWRVRLARPEGAGQRLKRLRGAIPVEVGVPPSEPSLAIPLAGSKGQTFVSGDVSVTIEEFGPGPNGTTSLKYSAKISGDRGPGGPAPKAVMWGRSSVLSRLISVVDADGQPAQVGSGSTATGDVLRVQSLFPRPVPGAALSARTPTHLRLHNPRWATIEVPFEFADLPLP